MPAMRAAVKHVCILMRCWLAMARVPPRPSALKVTALSGPSPRPTSAPTRARYIEPLLEGNSLANAGVWADTIRDDPAWAHTRPWHFINVDDGESLARAMASSRDNVLTAIDAVRARSGRRDLPLEAARGGPAFPGALRRRRSPAAARRAAAAIAAATTLRCAGASDDMSLHEFWDARALLGPRDCRPADLAAPSAPWPWARRRAGRPARPWTGREESRRYRPLIYDAAGGPGAAPAARSRAISRRPAMWSACGWPRPGSGWLAASIAWPARAAALAGQPGQAVEPAGASH